MLKNKFFYLGLMPAFIWFAFNHFFLESSFRSTAVLNVAGALGALLIVLGVSGMLFIGVSWPNRASGDSELRQKSSNARSVGLPLVIGLWVVVATGGFHNLYWSSMLALAEGGLNCGASVLGQQPLAREEQQRFTTLASVGKNIAFVESIGRSQCNPDDFARYMALSRYFGFDGRFVRENGLIREEDRLALTRHINSTLNIADLDRPDGLSLSP